MTTTDGKQNTKKAGKPPIQTDFEALPLEEKISNLFRMEAATVNEAVQYIARSPVQALEDVGEAIVRLGNKVELEIREAIRHRQAEKEEAAKSKPAPGASGGENTKGSTTRPPKEK